MYDAETVLRTVNDNAALVVALGALALAANWTYFFECARLARRDKCYPMALWATTVFMGHDGSYLLMANDWFNGYEGVPGNWFPPLFWVGLIVTFSFECIFFVQTIRYGRQEIAPRLSQQQWTAYCLLAAVTGIVFWAVTKTYLDDELYLMTFLVTFGMCAPATIPLMIRRGARIGVGAVQLWAYALIGVFYIALTVFVLGDPFDDPIWLLGSAVTLGLAAALLALFYRLPEKTAAVGSSATEFSPLR
jgi:hypothetical protein